MNGSLSAFVKALHVSDSFPATFPRLTTLGMCIQYMKHPLPTNTHILFLSMNVYARIHMQAYSIETENEINLVLWSTYLRLDWEHYFIVAFQVTWRAQVWTRLTIQSMKLEKAKLRTRSMPSLKNCVHKICKSIPEKSFLFGQEHQLDDLPQFFSHNTCDFFNYSFISKCKFIITPPF